MDKDLLQLWTFVRSFRPTKPERLCTFLVRVGGINDVGGDVRQLIGHTRSRPGLISSRGRCVDKMAELCCEQGFITESTESELLDAISKDLTTEGVYRLCDLGAYAQWSEWMMYYHELDKLGLMHLASVAQVIRALSTMEDQDVGVQGQSVKVEDLEEVPESIPF